MLFGVIVTVTYARPPCGMVTVFGVAATVKSGPFRVSVAPVVETIVR
jgi:hypothetical protein